MNVLLDRFMNGKRQKKPGPWQSVASEEAQASKNALKHTAITDAEVKERMKRIDEDFIHAFNLIKEYPNTVSFFGSSVISPKSKYYAQARELARKIVEELDLSIVSGGGPGIMEAANRGAREAKGDSIAAAIELPHEQIKNRFATHSADFYYFFSRKVALTFTARAYVYFPGGFGTLDELFEILTLKETGKIPPLPVILVGSDYWAPLLKFIEGTLYEKLGVISEASTKLYIQEDDHDKIVRIVSEQAWT
jgi:uncharacterized protein (TIGR00730 family)